MKTSFIRSFRRTLRQFERLNQLLTSTCCKGVTMAQCHVLLDIEESVETTIVQLVKNLKLDKSTLSRTVEALVRLGLVERKPHPTDRRFTILALTAPGKKICEEINREGDHTYLQAFQRIPRNKRDEIRGSFELLVEAMMAGQQTQTEDNGCCS
jgi:DNA-binding MarR family transcriptional regulator